MKLSKTLLSLLAMTLLTHFAQAKILSVEIKDVPVTPSGTNPYLIVFFEACPGSYDTVDPEFH